MVGGWAFFKGELFPHKHIVNFTFPLYSLWPMQAHLSHALHTEVVGSTADGPAVSHVQATLALCRLKKLRQTLPPKIQEALHQRDKISNRK